MSSPPPQSPPAHDAEVKDAPLKEIVYYGLGTLENSLTSQFFVLINTVMIVALGMSPVLLGLILSIKTIWDGVADPVMAQITDNAQTRWGRRRPFILIGGLGRVLVFVAIFAFFPSDASIKTNAQLAAEQKAMTELVTPSAQGPSAAQSAPAEGAAAEAAAPAAEVKPAAAPKPAPSPGLFGSIKEGYHTFMAADNAYHQKVTIYLLVACLLITTFGTMINVPYYALGIELCPSYDGRTRVVTYRSIVDKTVGLFAPWVLPFCFLPIFYDVIQGMLWYSMICVALGVPAVVFMVINIKERMAHVVVRKSGASSPRDKGPGMLRSIWLTAKNVHFLKILFLYQFIGYTNGIFSQIGLFLTIYWVFGGDALAGATLGGYAGTLATAIAFAALPVINWSCRRLQKHRTLRYGIIWMSIGTALNWVLITPEHPYWQLILPFFFSLGISSVYTILPTMMADVTDIDELQNGTRREGMFGAVMGFLMKLTGTLQPLLAGVVLVIAGFDAGLGAHQTPETILRMRVMFSIIPASLLLLALIALWRYPLTREYMAEVNEKLKKIRAKRRLDQAAAEG